MVRFPTLDEIAKEVANKAIDDVIYRDKTIREWIDMFANNDVQVVKHSKWVGFPNNGVWDLKCDNCHRVIPFGQTPETMHYCPLCGAKMDAQ